MDPAPPESPPETATGLPDFEIVTAKHPAALSLNSSGPLRARICNQGDTAGGTEVSFFFSLDKAFSSRDRLVTTSAPIFLSAGECRDVSKLVRPEVPDNHYFVFAVADADMLVSEGQEDNNARMGEKILVDFGAPARPVLILDGGRVNASRGRFSEGHRGGRRFQSEPVYSLHGFDSRRLRA